MDEQRRRSKKTREKESDISPVLVWALAIVALVILFNQWQIFSLHGLLGVQQSVFSRISSPLPSFLSSGSADLSTVDINELKSTAHSIAAVFPKEDLATVDKAIQTLIPTGAANYGQEYGLTYDDPVASLSTLQKLYYKIKDEMTPEQKQRYLNLATKPVGISCEFCCGVGPVGITKDGQLTCGCSHNPAIHALTIYLMKNTEMSDAEIIREAMRWKALWFPRNMIDLAVKIGGGDTSVLQNLPGMVGGC